MLVSSGSVLQKGKGWIALVRPANILIAVFSIAVAALIAGARAFYPVLIACLAGGWITAAANSINDYFDIEIDRINKPHRPLASGLLSKKTALITAALSAFLGLFFSALINFTALLMAGLAIPLLFFYSAFFKGTVLIGNLTVSLLTALAFLFGSAAVGHVSAGLIPATFAFLMHFAREIIKDMQDVRGDRQHQADTLPVRYGIKPARFLVSILLGFLMVVTWLPFYFAWYGHWYAGILAIGIYPVLIYTIGKLWHRSDERTLGRLSGLLKADMIIGLLAIYAGKW
ncbi:geranylgeranylglycerol-phosphate geranylgeranyltransferase [candidate division KSB1 bacterium]|nr:geranylgeranylglycerol-phosphate geranylgeranyltransferase [candidate division KSB1 bacterium]